MVRMDANDFDYLHQCLLQQCFDDPIVKEFIYKWLPKKVKYLASQEAVKMNSRLNNDDFQDIAQHVAILMYNKLETINPGIPFRSWMCKAIQLATKNFIRKKNKEDSVDTTECNNLIEKQIEKARPFIPFNDVLNQKLHESIQRLPENLYIPFVLKYVEGYSSKEIAEKMGITVSQVDQRNYRRGPTN